MVWFEVDHKEASEFAILCSLQNQFPIPYVEEIHESDPEVADSALMW